jgi:queuine tRNA-ribosyltransferase
LFVANEILALQLASMHNIAFYLWLVKSAREHIAAGDFVQWKKDMLEKFNSNM